MSLKIAISGASGFVGKALSNSFKSARYEVVPIVRDNSSGIKWDPYKGLIEKEKLKGINAFIHLSGENIASGRWNEKKKEKILQSRTIPTTYLANLISTFPDPKPLFLSASAIGIYGNRDDELLTEESLPGDGFFPKVATLWEESTLAAKNSGSRTINMRFGVVLDPSGGALKKMLLPFKLGLGGPLGSGNQYMSWISLSDLIKAVHHLLKSSTLSGPINFTSPNPITNEAFTKALGRALKRPAVFRVPETILRIVLGDLADEALLCSAKVYPKALLEDGFSFDDPTIESCLSALR